MFKFGDIVKVKDSYSEEWLRGAVIRLTNYNASVFSWPYEGICLAVKDCEDEDDYEEAGVGETYAFLPESLELV